MVSGKIGVIAAVRKTGCYLDGVLNYGYVEKKSGGALWQFVFAPPRRWSIFGFAEGFSRETSRSVKFTPC
jgi:hypothetical protein